MNKSIFNRIQLALWNNKGESYVDTGVKMLLSIVIGALLLTGIYAITRDVVLENVESQISDFFDQTPTLNGGSGNGGSNGSDGSGGGNGSGGNADPEPTGFPIAWNTVDVMDNAGVYLDGFTYVKVSDYTPTTEEILMSKIIFDGYFGYICVEPDIIDDETTLFTYCIEIPDGDMYFDAVAAASAGNHDGVDIPEAGFYVLNVGGMYDENVDFTIDLCEPIFTLQDWGGMFEDYGSYLKDFEYERGMTWGEWIEKYDPDNQVLKLNTESVNENGSPAVYCACNPISGDYYPDEVIVDSTSEQVYAEDAIYPILYTVHHK